MSTADRNRWDNYYRQLNRAVFPEPDPLLLEVVPPAPSRDTRALDLAGGMGQNGLWLAEQGYTVDVLDISRMALIRGRAEMVSRDIRTVNFLQQDLDDTSLKLSRYLVVCVFRYFRRALIPMLRTSVQPGGRIVYETYNTRYLDIVPDFNTDFLPEPTELASYFADWKILHHSHADHISRVAALKPEQP